jgi:hypothetical protein
MRQQAEFETFHLLNRDLRGQNLAVKHGGPAEIVTGMSVQTRRLLLMTGSSLSTSHRGGTFRVITAI